MFNVRFDVLSMSIFTFGSVYLLLLLFFSQSEACYYFHCFSQIIKHLKTHTAACNNILLANERMTPASGFTLPSRKKPTMLNDDVHKYELPMDSHNTCCNGASVVLFKLLITNYQIVKVYGDHTVSSNP